MHPNAASYRNDFGDSDFLGNDAAGGLHMGLAGLMFSILRCRDGSTSHI